MGDAKKRKRAFFQNNRFCCFCGGSVTATTIEHAPPKVLFNEKKRPKSHEFPACRKCNNGTSDQDQIAALAVHTMADLGGSPLGSMHFDKLIRGVGNNQPDALRYMSGSSAPRWMKLRGLQRPVERVTIDPRLFSKWLDPWAAKLGYALWYHHAGRILTNRARVGVTWMPNASFIEGRVSNELLSMFEGFGSVRQGQWDTREQFCYKYSINRSIGIGAFVPILFQCCAIFIAVHEDSESISSREKLSYFKTDAIGGIRSE